MTRMIATISNDVSNIAIRALGALLLLTLLAACATPSSSGRSSLSPVNVDMSQLPGWTGSTKHGFFICSKKADCPNLKLVAYKKQIANAASINTLTNYEAGSDEIGALLQAGFIIAGSGQGNATIELDGDPEPYSAAGLKGITFPIKGTTKSGAPRDPGHMIMLGDGNQMHTFIGISKSKAEAKDAVVKVVNAFTP